MPSNFLPRLIVQALICFAVMVCMTLIMLFTGRANWSFLTFPAFIIVGTLFTTIGVVIGDAICRFTRPDVLFAPNGTEMFRQKVFWLIGPQFVGWLFGYIATQSAMGHVPGIKAEPQLAPGTFLFTEFVGKCARVKQTTLYNAFRITTAPQMRETEARCAAIEQQAQPAAMRFYSEQDRRVMDCVTAMASAYLDSHGVQSADLVYQDSRVQSANLDIAERIELQCIANPDMASAKPSPAVQATPTPMQTTATQETPAAAPQAEAARNPKEQACLDAKIAEASKPDADGEVSPIKYDVIQEWTAECKAAQ